MLLKVLRKFLMCQLSIIYLFFLLYMFREAELEQDNGLFIGPPPPAVVTEAESTNEAERFEEVLSFLISSH